MCKFCGDMCLLAMALFLCVFFSIYCVIIGVWWVLPHIAKDSFEKGQLIAFEDTEKNNNNNKKKKKKKKKQPKNKQAQIEQMYEKH